MTFRPFPVLRELQKSDLNGAAQLLGRAMCDNYPVIVRAFGIDNRERRVRAMSRFFLPVLEGLYGRGLIAGALHDAKLVGVCGMARPQRCQPRIVEKFRVFPSPGCCRRCKRLDFRCGVARREVRFSRIRTQPSDHAHPPHRGRAGREGDRAQSKCL